MTEALITLSVFCLVLGLIGLGITRGHGRNMPKIPKPEVSLWVEDALIWSLMPTMGHPTFDNLVTGEIIAVHRNGTITVRDWESGDEHRCLGTGFKIPARGDEAIMRSLRTQQDSYEMGESQSKSVH